MLSLRWNKKKLRWNDWRRSCSSNSSRGAAVVMDTGTVVVAWVSAIAVPGARFRQWMTTVTETTTSIAKEQIYIQAVEIVIAIAAVIVIQLNMVAAAAVLVQGV